MTLNNIRGRSLITLLGLVSFFILVISGTVLAFGPRGYAARQLNWQFIGLTRWEWSDLHVVFAVLFLSVMALHIWLNRKPLWHHLRERLAYHRSVLLPGRVTPEFVVAIVIAATVLVFSIWDLPPVSYISDLQQQARKSWDDGTLHGGNGHGGADRGNGW